MTREEILRKAIEIDAADIFLVAGLPVTFKCGGRQERMQGDFLRPDDITLLVDAIYETSRRERTNIDRGVDDDFSFAVSQLGRFRVNVFRQRGSLAAVIRVIRFGLPDPVKLGIPESVLSLADNKKGLVLITGSAGTGKSTTLACMIDRINRARDCHIITMEDPIEYIHRHNKAIVTQREISIDTPGYLESLRSALRESPDVILLGEMRDYDTISAAITAAETGVLLLSTLHTSSAANTINRILDVFPANQQKQVKIQLAQILKGVVCQQLVPTVPDRGVRDPEDHSCHPEHDPRGQAAPARVGDAGGRRGWHVHHGRQPAEALPREENHEGHRTALLRELREYGQAPELVKSRRLFFFLKG